MQKSRIQATLRPRATNFTVFSQKLKEGSVYVIKTFGVAENNNYPLTSHKYRISFTKMTSLHEVSNDDIPFSLFDFKTFSEIESFDEKTSPFGNLYFTIFMIYFLIYRYVTLSNEIFVMQILSHRLLNGVSSERLTLTDLGVVILRMLI